VSSCLRVIGSVSGATFRNTLSSDLDSLMA
jgi:hypothetical protein